MENWEEIFRRRGAVHKKPLKSLIELIPILKKNKVKKIKRKSVTIGKIRTNWIVLARKK